MHLHSIAARLIIPSSVDELRRRQGRMLDLLGSGRNSCHHAGPEQGGQRLCPAADRPEPYPESARTTPVAPLKHGRYR
jgi:hypothetical protein